MAALQSPDPVCRAGSVSPPDSEVMDLGYKKNHEAERSTLHGKKETPVKTGVSSKHWKNDLGVSFFF